MKSGRNLNALAAELIRQNNAKHDYLVHSTEILADMVTVEATEDSPKRREPRLLMAGAQSLPLTAYCHDQLAERLGVRKDYWQRMLTAAPVLWMDTANTWLKELNEMRMVRELDGKARAFLSDRYRRLDNFDVANVALPILLENDKLRVASCEVTETRLYIKALFPGRTAEVTVGDVVEAGVYIANSEVGAGALTVAPFVNRLICKNGMVVNDSKWRQQHVGRRITNADIKLSDETQQKLDAALLSELKDVMLATSGEIFDRTVEKMREATQGPQLKRPTAGVQLMGKSLGLLESETESVLERLMRAGDYSRYGALNAVTNLANDATTYDRATELEQLGGRILELPAKDWKVIAEAA